MTFFAGSLLSRTLAIEFGGLSMLGISSEWITFWLIVGPFCGIEEMIVLADGGGFFAQEAPRPRLSTLSFEDALYLASMSKCLACAAARISFCLRTR